MEIKVMKKEFSKNIGMALKGIPLKTDLPILKCVLIETTKDGINICASDKNIFVSIQNNAEIIKEGRACIDAKLLDGVLKKIKKEMELILRIEGDEVVIEFDTSQVKIKTIEADNPESPNPETSSNLEVTSKVKLKIMDASNYPKMPNPEISSSFEVTGESIIETIKQVSFSTVKNEGRPVLQGILLSISDDILTMVSTDGYRMSLRLNKMENINGIIDFKESIIHVDSLLSAGKVIATYKKEKITVGLTNEYIKFNIKNASIISKLTKEEFLNYKPIFGVKEETKVIVDRLSFIEILKRASLFTLKDKVALVKLSVKVDRIDISILSDAGKIEETVQASVLGELIDIHFNVSYLTAPLSVIQGDRISLSFTDKVSPCMIQSSDNKLYKHMVLPIRIKDIPDNEVIPEA